MPIHIRAMALAPSSFAPMWPIRMRFTCQPSMPITWPSDIGSASRKRDIASLVSESDADSSASWLASSVGAEVVGAASSRSDSPSCSSSSGSRAGAGIPACPPPSISPSLAPLPISLSAAPLVLQRRSSSWPARAVSASVNQPELGAAPISALSAAMGFGTAPSLLLQRRSSSWPLCGVRQASPRC